MALVLVKKRLVFYEGYWSTEDMKTGKASLIIICIDEKIHDKFREKFIQWSTQVSSQVYGGQKLINEYLKFMYFYDLYLLS